jgi:hypothetical protein
LRSAKLSSKERGKEKKRKDGLDVIRDGVDVLDGSSVSDDSVLHVVVPETEVDELPQQPHKGEKPIAGGTEDKEKRKPHLV